MKLAFSMDFMEILLSIDSKKIFSIKINIWKTFEGKSQLKRFGTLSTTQFEHFFLLLIVVISDKTAFVLEIQMKKKMKLIRYENCK